MRKVNGEGSAPNYGAVALEVMPRRTLSAASARSSVNPKLEEAIAKESGAKVGPALWADTLGPEDSSGATYLDAMRFNAEALAEGFSDGAVRCDLPR